MGTTANRQSNCVNVKIVLQNSSDRITFKDIELTIIDTINARLLREVHKKFHINIIYK